MGTGESGKPPDRLSRIESELRDERTTDGDWPPERPTAKRIRAIESMGPPASYPPKVGRHWNPAGVVLVITAFGGVMTTVGVAIGPYLSKPDLTGLVKEERLTACEAKLDARGEAHEKAIESERARTGSCYNALGDCRSQQGAQGQVIQSLESKRRR